jgi:hypothetical protein
LQLDLTNGDPLPWAGVTFEGGVGDNDRVSVLGTLADDTLAVGANSLTPANGASLTYQGTENLKISTLGGSDTLQYDAKPAAALDFMAGSGIDLISVNDETLAIDEGLTQRGLVVDVAKDATIVVSTEQHLDGLIIAGEIVVAPGGDNTLYTKTLDLLPGAKLDLNDNSLIVDYTGQSPLGAWDGDSYDGITGLVAGTGDAAIVSTAANNSGDLTTLAVAEAAIVFDIPEDGTALFAGKTIDATTVIVKYTYAGDADLDGTVDIDDYGVIDFNVANGTRNYTSGDLNLDGQLDIDDIAKIDFAAPLELPPL